MEIIPHPNCVTEYVTTTGQKLRVAATTLNEFITADGEILVMKQTILLEKIPVGKYEKKPIEIQQKRGRKQGYRKPKQPTTTIPETQQQIINLADETVKQIDLSDNTTLY